VNRGDLFSKTEKFVAGLLMSLLPDAGGETAVLDARALNKAITEVARRPPWFAGLLGPEFWPSRFLKRDPHGYQIVSNC